VEEEVAKLAAHLPETIRVKEAELGAEEERRLGNFLDFIGEGRGSEALTKVLLETKRRDKALREKLEGLREFACSRVREFGCSSTRGTKPWSPSAPRAARAWPSRTNSGSTGAR
jgi:hypothetical protein